MQTSFSYECVAGALAHLREKPSEAIALSDIADALQIDEQQLRQAFLLWAGVSPEHFLQQLAHDALKSRLLDTASGTAEASLAAPAAHSGAGTRDVVLEAMTAEDYGDRGSALTVSIAEHETLHGRALLASTHRGICGISFAEADEGRSDASSFLRQYPRAKVHRGVDAHQSGAVVRVNHAGPAHSPLTLHVCGTPFQLQVWQTLLRIPWGRLASYSQIAQLLGKPGSARAVGTAVGSNPVALLIPCHRVIQANGRPGAYRWGAARKCALIALESVLQASRAG